MIVLYDNLFDAATLTSGGAIPGFPLSNLIDTRISRVYRAISDTDAIVMDFGQAITADCFSLVGYNIRSATVVLEAHTTNSWGAPDFTETIQVADYMTFTTFSEASYRWWRLRVDDANSQLGQLQIGRIGLGVHLQMPLVEAERALPRRSATDIGFSRSRQAYFNDGLEWRAANITFPFIEQDEREAIESMWSVARGKPVFIDFPEMPQELPLYGLLSPGELSLSYNRNINRYAVGVSIEEVF